MRAYHVRNQDDPDEVITVAFFEGTEEEIDAMRDDPDWMAGEERRLKRIAPLEESIKLAGVYEVVEEIVPRRSKKPVPSDAKDPMAAIAVAPRDEWLTALNGPPAVREPALAELHALLLRAARSSWAGAAVLSDVAHDRDRGPRRPGGGRRHGRPARQARHVPRRRAASRPGPTSSRCSRRA